MEDKDQTAKLGRLCIEFLDGMLEEINRFGDDVYVIDNERLASLNIRKAEPLDIEEKRVDFGPRFFCPRFTLEETRQKTSDFLADAYPDRTEYPEWRKRCRRGSYSEFVWGEEPGPHDPEDFHPLCTPMTDAERRLEWCEEVMGGSGPDESPNRGVWDGSCWRYLASWHLIPDEWGNSSLPGHHGSVRVGRPARFYTFDVNRAFLIEDRFADMPHIGGTVVDAAESGEGEVLRSEVVAAVALLKLQFRLDHFCRHHTLPAIVFSFQHDNLGRVSQFHCHGKSLVLRQSRLLDFRSDEPTTDAYQMLRWMANRPMGETRFPNAVDGEVEGCGFWDTDKDDGKLPVDVRGG
ncbi:uncharacterized protein B0H64DRAFT_395092 [Chaetomium fimeti]|uniref:Uncharacterized protein n=1 Tax=Chaetomium fimeti TaxID=1854472 RepID=A0AAE0HF46_9PEZI|nr:hypothetical protein B0H64DRAFT_395092 [Chaetomium fimeti]